MDKRVSKCIICSKPTKEKRKRCLECRIEFLKSRIKRCVDCDVEIQSRSTRCQACFMKIYTNPNKINPDINILAEEAKTQTLTALGKKYNVSANAVKKWLKKAGLFVPKVSHYNRKEFFEMDEIRKDRENGMSYRQLGEKYKVDKGMIAKWLREKEPEKDTDNSEDSDSSDSDSSDSDIDSEVDQ